MQANKCKSIGVSWLLLIVSGYRVTAAVTFCNIFYLEIVSGYPRQLFGLKCCKKFAKHQNNMLSCSKLHLEAEKCLSVARKHHVVSQISCHISMIWNENSNTMNRFYTMNTCSDDSWKQWNNFSTPSTAHFCQNIQEIARNINQHSYCCFIATHCTTSPTPSTTPKTAEKQIFLKEIILIMLFGLVFLFLNVIMMKEWLF